MEKLKIEMQRFNVASILLMVYYIKRGYFDEKNKYRDT